MDRPTLTDRNCPLCGRPTESQHLARLQSDEIGLNCERCGEYRIDELTAIHLDSMELSDLSRAALSHTIRRMTGTKGRPKISRDLIGDIAESPSLPTPDEQAEGLILLLGDALRTPAEFLDIDKPSYEAAVGVVDRRGLHFIVRALEAENLIKMREAHGPMGLTLTFYGWRRYQELRRGRSDSKKAFMAMPFGSPELSRVYRECFKAAVAKTGFHLERLDEEPRAGSIDDRLRVEIRTARFLVAELTLGNRGVYWEAGFAEGLGKPVIYTCRKDYFEQEGTHFDTNHLHTVLWDPDDLHKAGAQLKDTIRATLPEEALMEDC